MRFSIIVVSFNSGARLRATLESIRCQTFTDYEVIIKDACSKDGSADCIPEFRDMNPKFIVGKDSGIYDGMNTAVKEASGDYIFFLNCGDYFYDKDILAKVSECIDGCEGEEYDIYYGDIYDRPSEKVISSNPKIDTFACYRNLPCHQAVFYSAELFGERGFDIRYRVRADYEHFLYCFFERKAKCRYMGFVISDYEGGGFSETKEGTGLSRKEHREITKIYMSPFQRFKYRAVMILTLAGLRARIARNPKTAGFYNSLKAKVYKNK